MLSLFALPLPPEGALHSYIGPILVPEASSVPISGRSRQSKTGSVGEAKKETRYFDVLRFVPVEGVVNEQFLRAFFKATSPGFTVPNDTDATIPSLKAEHSYIEHS